MVLLSRKNSCRRCKTVLAFFVIYDKILCGDDINVEKNR